MGLAIACWLPLLPPVWLACWVLASQAAQGLNGVLRLDAGSAVVADSPPAKLAAKLVLAGCVFGAAGLADAVSEQHHALTGRYIGAGRGVRLKAVSNAFFGQLALGECEVALAAERATARGRHDAQRGC